LKCLISLDFPVHEKPEKENLSTVKTASRTLMDNHHFWKRIITYCITSVIKKIKVKESLNINGQATFLESSSPIVPRDNPRLLGIIS